MYRKRGIKKSEKVEEGGGGGGRGGKGEGGKLYPSHPGCDVREKMKMKMKRKGDANPLLFIVYSCMPEIPEDKSGACGRFITWIGKAGARAGG